MDNILIIVVLVVSSGDSNDETIQKLQNFAKLEKRENKYIFTTGDIWAINYVDVNEFVEFKNRQVYECLYPYFGEYDFGNDGWFSYDLSENEARIYVDYEHSEGKLSLINYNIDKDKFTVMLDGERYEAADEFSSYLKDCGIIEAMKANLEVFKNELIDHGLSIEQVTHLNYKDIVDYFK